MKNPSIIFLIIISVLFTSCEFELPIVSIPYEEIQNSLKGTKVLSLSSLKILEGLYLVTTGKSQIGDTVVIKANEKGISLFTKKNFSILETGQKNNQIIFAGYWRIPQGNESGFVNLTIDDKTTVDGITGAIRPANIIISGIFKSQNNTNKDISIRFIKELVKSDFKIIGHRGGGRNVDRYPASENSLEMIKLAPTLGANAVELDVRLTKDGVPVLFHDDNLSKRLIQQDYFIGSISDYTFKQLRGICKLKNGEEIPTLEEALKTIVDSTNLSLVWLDVKASNLISQIVPLQKKHMAKAKDLNKTLEIMIGLPDETIYSEFLNYAGYKDCLSLCELDETFVLNANSSIWAPRWSLGLIPDRVSAMHSSGKRVFVWTLDEVQFIQRYISEGNFDGIVTNYPSVVAYEYYTKK